jgi:hypothetical protein
MTLRAKVSSAVQLSLLFPEIYEWHVNLEEEPDMIINEITFSGLLSLYLSYLFTIHLYLSIITKGLD